MRREPLAIGDDDPCPGLVESSGEGRPDSSGGAGDDHVFPVEFHAGHRRCAREREKADTVFGDDRSGSHHGVRSLPGRAAGRAV